MFVTVYTRTVKRRASGRTETEGRVYRTKTLTAHHAYIRSIYPDAQTFENPTRVITDFVPGMNLRIRPLVFGGKQVA